MSNAKYIIPIAIAGVTYSADIDSTSIEGDQSYLSTKTEINVVNNRNLYYHNALNIDETPIVSDEMLEKAFNNFARKMIENSKEMDPEIAEYVSENIMDLL
jgi:hypothetical protein